MAPDRNGPVPWLPPFRVQVVLAAASTLLFILWSQNEWGGPRTSVAFADLMSTLVPAVTAWACWRRSRASSDDLRLAWRLIGAACLSWALGQAYWTWVELRTGVPPEVPSLADVGYLGLLPLAAVGVASLARRPGPGLDPRPLLEGAIVGASFIFIAFTLGLEGILLDSRASDTALIVNLLYPFGDGLVIGVALMRLSRAPRKAWGATGLLASGFVMLAIADLWFLVVDAQGVYATGGILDAFWVMGFQLIGLSAVRPSNLETAVDAPPQTRARALIPLYPFFAAIVASMVAEVRVGYFSDTLYWTALVVIFLVLARLVVMLFDNFRLTGSLEEEKALRIQMLNNVTHDLLSPLSTVRLQLRLLQGDALGSRSPRQDHALMLLDRNVERVNRLGNDLKDMANLEGHGMVVLPGACDLTTEARKAVAAFADEALQRGLQLDVQGPVAAPLVADAGRIAQVVDNLLSNALKFTPAGGRIVVRIEADGSGWSLSVIDSGRGLTPAEASRLFQPFSQVHAPGEIKERGTGLGLYISHGIATRHGGSLTVTSAGLGHGSTFRLRLPAAMPGANTPTLPAA